MRTLVALDLDGTLLDERSVLPAGHEHAIAELRRQGILVAIVTGRPVLTARRVHEHLRLTTPLVAFNGGWVGHLDGTPPLAVAPLGAEAVREVIDTLAGWPGALCAYPDAGTWLMDRDTQHTSRWSRYYGARCAGCHGPSAHLALEPLLRRQHPGRPEQLLYLDRPDP